jgi:murein L,D-transpeptidase YafK
VKRALLMLGLAAIPVGALAARAGPYARIDQCLATQGNAWDYRANRCGPTASGPVDRIFVDKSEHWMAVYRQGRIIREFRVALGRGGLAPKVRQGDGRVPEGTYPIVAHNPNSAYYLSLRIGYPTPDQLAAARAQGVDPGTDIMIHGLPNGRGWIGSRHRRLNWTEGCIALTDPEMQWLYANVPDGIPIEIRA